MILTHHTCLQAMSENQDILDLLQENQEEMGLLAELYNEHKERLDQAKLNHDLERLRAYVCLHHIHSANKLTTTAVRSTNSTNGSSKSAMVNYIEGSRH